MVRPLTLAWYWLPEVFSLTWMTLPPAAAYEAAVFPTLDEQAAAKAAITKNWDAVVGANVQ